MENPNFNEEKKLWRRGYKLVVGLDEAGRGPLAGPVIACAITVRQIPNSKFQALKLRDSKQLTEKQREKFYKILTRNSDIEWGVGIVSEKIIDKINILEATKLAMKKAVKNLEKKINLKKNIKKQSCQILRDRVKSDMKKSAEFLIVDGKMNLNITLPQKSIIKADKKVFSCAAASIIAKVTRDRIMKKYDKKYPQYGFKKHKGYPTRAHFAVLQRLGPCPIHRKSFSF